MFDNVYMREALNQARIAYKNSEIPVGAIIVNSAGEIISTGSNMVEKCKNPMMHAENIAIFRALRKLKQKSLTGCSLYVTLEPCYMCAGAIANSKISRVYIGAEDRRFGAILNGARIYQNKLVNFTPEVYGDIMELECQELLDSFFQKLRC